jgi:hypothetical protein
LLNIVIFVADYYMLVDSSDASSGDQVMLLSPPYSSDFPRQMTFYFYMHLDAADTTAALSVYKYSSLKTYDQQLFTVSGDHGNLWQKGTICLPAGQYQVAFVAKIGFAYLSDIALDIVSLDESGVACSPSAETRAQGWLAFSLPLHFASYCLSGPSNIANAIFI